MDDRPYFLWSDDDRVTDAELRTKLRSSDVHERALWEGRVLREARFRDVWKYVTLQQVLADWQYLERHLGRRRDFWRFTLDGWRKLGLITS
jgi:hypothetical protein